MNKANKTLKEKLNKAIKKGHNRVLIFNNHANCLNLFDLDAPEKRSKRICLLKNWNTNGWEEIGLPFQIFKTDLKFFKSFNEFVGSWNDSE